MGRASTVDISHISMMYIFRDLALSNPGKSTKFHIYNDKKGGGEGVQGGRMAELGDNVAVKWGQGGKMAGHGGKGCKAGKGTWRKGARGKGIREEGDKGARGRMGDGISGKRSAGRDRA